MKTAAVSVKLKAKNAAIIDPDPRQPCRHYMSHLVDRYCGPIYECQNCNQPGEKHRRDVHADKPDNPLEPNERAGDQADE
jgi:hypothetical protein